MKQKLTLFIFVLSSTLMLAQTEAQFSMSDTTKVNKEYPYILPIWGQKVLDRGVTPQLPFGINANYVYNRMDLELTELSIAFNDGENLDDLLNAETLNFSNTVAESMGLNLRLDAWLFPFMNIYGIYAENKGSTKVSLQPNIPIGDQIISLPHLDIDPVSFDSHTVGIGTTLVYGWGRTFVSFDGNYTSSKSNLTTDRVGLIVASGRIGRVATFENGMKLAAYIGFMYRDFVDPGNTGSMNLKHAMPGLGDNILNGIDDKIVSNNEEILKLETEKPPGYRLEIEKLEKQNALLGGAYDRIDEAVNSEVTYSIKKEITQKVSAQLGFNWELTPEWMFRGEFGFSTGQTFVLAGLQYRFGL